MRQARRFGPILQTSTLTGWKGDNLAKPNNQFEKRQRDLAKKKKQEEKRLRKLEKSTVPGVVNPDQPEAPLQVPESGEPT